MDFINISKALQMTFPATADALKKQYHRLALEFHPDRQGGDEEAFKLLSAAYGFIKKHPENFIVISVDSKNVTIEGISFADLGLGLGPTINGRDCNICNGEGHVPFVGNTIYYKNCKACSATGRISIGNRSRDCYVCNGSGEYVTEVEQGERKVCYNCQGTGELRVWNPVIPKGAILMNRRNK